VEKKVYGEVCAHYLLLSKQSVGEKIVFVSFIQCFSHNKKILASHGGLWLFYHDVVVMSCAIETNFGDGQCLGMEDGVALHRKKLCTHRKILCTWKFCKLKYIEVYAKHKTEVRCRVRPKVEISVVWVG